MTKQLDSILRCECCKNELVLFEKNKFWQFWRCPNCGFWTSRALDGTFPSYEYYNVPTFA